MTTKRNPEVVPFRVEPAVIPLKGGAFQVVWLGMINDPLARNHTRIVASDLPCTAGELFQYAEKLRQQANAIERFAGGAACSP